MRLTGLGETLNLPEARLWNIPFVVPEQTLTPGLRWTDTLSYKADPGEGLFEELSGVWENQVVGDTVIDGRSLPLVSSEATIRYRSVEPMRDYAQEGPLIVEKDCQGTITGWAAVDTTLSVRAAGADSLRWNGMAFLKTQDGTSYLSPIRYEGTRTWLLRDSLDWAVLQDSSRARRRREGTGMLMLPHRPIEERLAEGDSILADSVRQAWIETENPNERQELGRLLSLWGDHSRSGRKALEDWMLDQRLALGDSARVVDDLLRSTQSGLVGDRLELVLPYLDDIGRLWRLGVNPRYAYGQMADNLMGSSPLLEPDTTRWDLDPATCDRLLGLEATATEPRLKDVGLAGSFARAPAPLYEALSARADEGSLIAREALEMARGVGATWEAAPKDPMPPPGADWTEWLSWMGGSVRFQTSHRDALRLYAAATGRDPLEELRRSWPPAGDSAQLVIGTILRGMDALPPPTDQELVEAFLSGSRERIQGAGRELNHLLRPGAPLASEEIVEELAPDLVNMVLEGGDSPWPAVDGLVDDNADRIVHLVAVNLHGVEGVPLFLLDENLPERIASNLESTVELVDSATWINRPRRAGGAIIRILPVRSSGSFVAMVWDWTVLEKKAPDEAPSGYAGGGHVFLLKTEEGWQIVGHGAWIT
jgi:hypothetical protein